MPKKKPSYQRKLEYNNAYNRENYRSFSVRYSRENEKDIIDWLENQTSVKEYVTGLIRADIDKQKRKAHKTAKKAAE